MINLREYKEDDIDDLLRLANNAKVAEYLTDTFPHPYSKQDALWWIQEGCKTGVTKVIEYNGEFVGSVGAIPGVNEMRYSAVVGYWLGEPYWGKGIAYKALDILSNEIFNTTNIQRLHAGVYSPNKPSMRVLEKSGYDFEAVLKNSIYKNNQFYDEHIYAKLKP